MQLRIGATAMAAFAYACLAFQQGDGDESTVLATSFTEVGYKSEVKPTSFGKTVTILREGKPVYVFVYEKKGAGFERDLLFDPNVDKKRVVKESAFTVPAEFQGATATVKPMTLVHPAKARKMMPEESAALIAGLRAQEAVARTYFDGKGATTEGLPTGTVASEAWVQGDFYVLRLKHPKFTSVAEDPLIVRSYGSVLAVQYSAPEDGAFLPLHAGFDTVKTLCSNAKVGAPWNKVEPDAGQAGVWLRQRLATTMETEPMWPTQADDIVAKLEAVSPHLGGLVYAKHGNTAVAFFYTEENEPQVVEFDDGEVRAAMDLSDALSRAETTTEKDLWLCYEGISRQFAHPSIVLAVYRNEAMRES